MKFFVPAALAAATLLSSAATAEATTYAGSRSLNGVTADYSITTDGVMGVVSQADITAWSFTISSASATVTHNSGFLQALGGGLFATPTTLTFDFDAANADFMLLSSAHNAGFCIDSGGPNSCIGPQGSGVEMLLNGETGGDFAFQTQTGIQTIATAAGGVPEPASWALMIAGFGLAGAALRRRGGVFA